MIEKEHAFKTFNRDLKDENFGSLICLYGIEDYLITWAYNSIIDKYINPASKELDLVKIDGGEDISQIIDAANTFSMFSKKRVVICRDFKGLYQSKTKGLGKDEIEKFLSYLESPNEQTIIILTSEEFDEKSDFNKAVKNFAQYYNFDTLDEKTVSAFIEKRLKSHDIEPDKNIVKFILSISGYQNKDSDYRLYNLINDVDKIVAHAGLEKITEKDVTQTLFGDLETFVFDFLDAVSAHKKETAFKMLYNILNSGSDIYSILGLIINHFELMLIVLEFKKMGVSLNGMKDRLKIHEFRIKKALGYSESFSVEKLKSVLSRLYEVDRNIKTGALDGELSLELILADI